MEPVERRPDQAAGILRHCGCGEEIWRDPAGGEYRHVDARIDRRHDAALQLSIYDTLSDQQG